MEPCDIEGEFIKLDDKIIGINLGYSFASEHEWGIKELRTAFGHKTEELGFEGFVNTVIPKGLCLIRDAPGKEKGDMALIYVPINGIMLRHYDGSIEDICRSASDRNLNLYESRDIAAAWSESDFGVKVRKDNSAVLEDLFDAFNNKSGIIMLGPRGFMGNSGLSLLDYAKIPQEERDRVREQHKEAIETKALYKRLEDESGVIELLKKAGKNWCSLSVQGLDDGGEPLWWLNPYDQRNHQCGWYHTEDLKLWAEDKGPVMEMRK